MLRIKEEWEAFFILSNIPGDTASTYTTIFVQNHSTENVLPDLTKETLHDIIILNIIRGILNIIKHGNQ